MHLISLFFYITDSINYFMLHYKLPQPSNLKQHIFIVLAAQEFIQKLVGSSVLGPQKAAVKCELGLQSNVKA